MSDILSSKALIIPAAGSGTRMQRNQAKPFIKLEGQTILARTIDRFLPLQGLQKIIIATSSYYLKKAEDIVKKVVADRVSWQCVEGGAERQQSVYEALKIVTDVDIILVHDAVRPFITLQEIQKCCREANKMGAAILGIPSKDTIKELDRNYLVKCTPDRNFFWQIQTPQVFSAGLLKKAYTRAAKEGVKATDDASLVEWLGEPVKVVQGSARNIKITYPGDLALARILLKETKD